MVKTQIFGCSSVALAITCLVASPNPAAADELAPRANTLSLGVTAGVFFPDEDVHDFRYDTNAFRPLNSAGPAMGLRASYEPARFAALELEGELIPTGVNAPDASATIFGWRAQVVGEVPARVTPFMLFGLGSMGIISGDDVVGDDSDMVWHLGTGAKFFVNNDWSVRVDGRWLLAPKRDIVGEDDNMVSHFLITTSLSWRFGPFTRAQPDFEAKIEVAKAEQPPEDTDRDGIVDNSDKCPSEAETMNEVEDEDGCPDVEPDKDSDAIADRRDACPESAEDMDSFQDTDGCPDADNDGDGILDGKDSCALQSGPVDNLGCPDKDGDGDGLADRLDNCPAEPGFSQFRGCRNKQLVVIDQAQIKVLDNIYFASSKSSIRSRSNALLDNLAQVLNAHPEITRISIEGHTDNRGDADRNRNLSQSRAQSVVDYLAGRGVSASRMQAVGHGEDVPIADNKSSRGRSQNRRVEFRIERGTAAASAAIP
jgi:outer membrane protein OmpA-like peptidoglycan-associated protein